MNKVNLLAPDVIAKIAAGEAVERPASVVKELLENAIDAGATAVEIHLKEAGRELIHIKDNGCGIDREDLIKIFRRHATSKISAIEDLEKLRSMGFRGEALYSIAAVSDVSLSSRTAQGEAWQVHLRGGVRQELQPASLQGTGTDIKVAELFFNTPARRKFLKNNASELHQVLNIVLPYALIYPKLRFLLTHTGRTLLDLKAAPSSFDRAAAALNVRMDHLIQAEQEFVQEQIRIQMTLGDINLQRPRRDLQFIFINDRPVESKNLSFNLNDVYKLVLPPGVFGAFIINIRLNPAHVDVNIHPTKREVRIKDEAMLIRLLRHMVEYQLMQKGQVKELSSLGPTDGGLPAEKLIFAPGQWQAKFNPNTSSYSGREIFGSPQKPFGDENISTASDGSMKDFLLFGGDDSLRSKFMRARFIGSFLQKFLLFEVGASLLIVDQHAAQERIMFEKFKKQIDAAGVESQPLLSPLLIRLTPQEKLAFDGMHDKLNAAGIETTLFDDDTIAVHTQPLLLKNIENVVRALLNDGEIPRRGHDALARRACKASIVAGDKLDASQAEYQRKELLACNDPFTCPHGRPIIIEITQNTLDRQFLRT